MSLCSEQPVPLYRVFSPCVLIFPHVGEISESKTACTKGTCAVLTIKDSARFMYVCTFVCKCVCAYKIGIIFAITYLYEL